MNEISLPKYKRVNNLWFLATLDKWMKERRLWKKAAQESLQVTKECLIWQQVQKSLETRGFNNTGATVTQVTNKTCIGDLGLNLLIFDCNNVSGVFPDFVFKLIKQKRNSQALATAMSYITGFVFLISLFDTWISLIKFQFFCAILKVLQSLLFFKAVKQVQTWKRNVAQVVMN